MIYGDKITDEMMLGEIRGLLDLMQANWGKGEKERFYLHCRKQVQAESHARRLAGYTPEQWEDTGPRFGPFVSNAGCDHDRAWALWSVKMKALQPRIDAMLGEYEKPK